MRSSFIITRLLSAAAVAATISGAQLHAQTDEISTGDAGYQAGDRFPATTTVFGLYAPPIVKVRRVPTSNERPPASDFRNVEGGEEIDALNLTGTERRILRDNGLLLRAEGLASPGAAYASGGEIGRYITVDAVLAEVRGLATQAVAEAESGWMHDALAVELEGLATTVGAMPSADPDAQHRALAYIETGRLLLEPSATVDSRVAQLVRGERDRVVAARGNGGGELLGGRQIDYTIFRLPAGLDERRAELQRARLWFTRVGLPLREAGQTNLRAALLIARALDAVRAEPSAARRHDDLAALIATLAPHSDAAVPFSGFTRSFRLYVGRRLDSEPALYADAETIERYALWLDRDKGTLRQGEPRLFATPLMGAGAVGATATPSSGASESRVDESLLATLDGAFALTARGVVAAPTVPADRLPRYMRGEAWGRRLSLVAATPSGVAAKTGGAGRAAAGGAGDGHIYVEPIPAAWGHIAALAGYLHSGFGPERSEPAVSRATLQRLEEIEGASAALAQIAAAELAGRSPSGAETAFLVALCDRLAGGAGSGGTAMAIYAIVPVDSTGRLVLVRGGVAVPEGNGGTRLAGLVDPQRPADPVREVATGNATRQLPALQLAAQPSAHLTFDNGAWAPHDESEWWYTVRLGSAGRGLVSVELVDAAGRPVGKRVTEWVDGAEMVGVIDPRSLAPGTYTLRLRDGVGTPISSGLLAVLP